MEEVAVKNQLKMGVDVKKQMIGRAGDFNNYVETHRNTTLYSIVWCTDFWDVELLNHNAEIPCRFSKEHRDQGQEMIFYTMWYNSTLQESILFRPGYWPYPKNQDL